MQEKYEVVCDMLHGFEFAAVWGGGTHEQKLQLIGDAKELILGLDDGKQRFVDAVTALGKAFSLAVPSEMRSRSATTWASSRRCARRS